MSSICKYCEKVELTFDNAFKSKTGKLIPLDKSTGMPHKCNDNPYYQQQIATSMQSHARKSSFDEAEESTKNLLVTINEKLNRLLNLAERK